MRIRRDGTILVQSGVAHNGQGHFTAFAQIAAQTFDLPGSQVEVHRNAGFRMLDHPEKGDDSSYEDTPWYHKIYCSG